jgi:hypothetical protein
LTCSSRVVLNASVMRKPQPKALLDKFISHARGTRPFKMDWKLLVGEIENAGFHVHHPAVDTIANLMDHDLGQLDRQDPTVVHNINWLSGITGTNRTTISMWRLRNSIPRTRVEKLIDVFGQTSALNGAFKSGLLSVLEDHAIRIDRLRKIEDADNRKAAIREVFAERDERIARVNATGIAAEGQVGNVTVKTAGQKIVEVAASIRAASSARASGQAIRAVVEPPEDLDQEYYEALEEKRKAAEADYNAAKTYVVDHYRGPKFQFSRWFKKEYEEHLKDTNVSPKYEPIVHLFDNGDFLVEAYRIEVVDHVRGLTIGLKPRIHPSFYKAVLDVVHRVRRDDRLEYAVILFVIPETDSETEQKIAREYVEYLTQRYITPNRLTSEIKPSWLSVAKDWVDGINDWNDQEAQAIQRMEEDGGSFFDPVDELPEF